MKENAKPNFLGNIYGLHDGYDGSVFDVNYPCKTLTATPGGGGEHHCVLQHGYIEKGTGKHESNIVYSIQGVAPCVTASFCYKQPPTMVIVHGKF